MKKFVTVCSKSLLFAAFLVLCLCGTSLGQTVDYTALSKADLQEKIAELNLGLGSYIVGTQLTKEQIVLSGKNNDYKAYPGTVKFKDGNIFVISDVESHVVIAVYRRNKTANKNDFKITISELMLHYGEPTAEAHGKTIYWNFASDGLITEELYRSVKQQGMLDTLVVLATVKFTSTENVETMTDMIGMMNKKNQQGEKVKQADITSDNYVMVQSDMLTKKYLEK
ncbi:MAG: hypothetical protein KAR01_09185 [Desulfocapsa sp.]|nr:hypothetical protein [Desulfocapsa sp.]